MKTMTIKDFMKNSQHLSVWPLNYELRLWFFRGLAAILMLPIPFIAYHMFMILK